MFFRWLRIRNSPVTWNVSFLLSCGVWPSDVSMTHRRQTFCPSRSVPSSPDSGQNNDMRHRLPLTSFHFANFSSHVETKDANTQTDHFFQSLTDLLSSKSSSGWIWARIIIVPRWHRRSDNEQPQLSLMPASVLLPGDSNCHPKISPSSNSCTLF